MPYSIIILIVFGDKVELLADILRDVFDDLGVAVDVVEMVLEESYVEGEDAFEFDAEGDLEGRVYHVCGVLLMERLVVLILILVRDVQDDCVFRLGTHRPIICIYQR